MGGEGLVFFGKGQSKRCEGEISRADRPTSLDPEVGVAR